MFTIPLSPTLKSIYFILAGIGILLTPTYMRSFSFVLSQNWCKIALSFFLMVVISCLWTSANAHTCWSFIEKYSKLLYLPIFAIGFQNRKTRMIAIYAFILAMFLTCLISVSEIGPITIRDVGPDDPGHVFFNRIVTSFMMAFAAYLSGLFVIRRTGIQRILFSLLLLLFSYQIIFVNTGRPGYVLYFILMMMLLIHLFPLKQLIIAMLCFSVLFIVTAKTSTIFKERIHEVVTEWNNYQSGEKKSALGYRLMYHQYATSLFLSNPIIGHGTGGFSHALEINNPWPEKAGLMEPHGQYWLIASEYGLLGLTLLLGFLGTLLITAFRLHEMKMVMFGMLTAFAIANLSDSLLAFSAIGHLFVMFSALCMGEFVESYSTGSLSILKKTPNEMKDVAICT